MRRGRSHGTPSERERVRARTRSVLDRSSTEVGRGNRSMVEHEHAVAEALLAEEQSLGALARGQADPHQPSAVLTREMCAAAGKPVRRTP